MSLSIGIVGLPNVGKSTLFNALLKRQVALAANYPFATIEPNIGVVDVPDERLQKLADLVKNEFSPKDKPADPNRPIPEKIIPAVVKFYDIAGLVKGAHKGEGLGNQFLSHIREVDAIVQVVRDFNDTNVIREGSVNPKEDMSTINTELILADVQVMETKIQRHEIALKKDKNPENEQKMSSYIKILESLNEGTLVYDLITEIKKDSTILESVKKDLDTLNLLTAKPMLYVFNISESDLSSVLTKEGHSDNETIYLSAKIESELSSLVEDDQQAYMQELGIAESGLDKVIQTGYKMLNLQTFFTAGPKEIRAWTITKGSKAPQAAGKIHTDFERGFIRAEVIAYNDLISAGNYKNAKERGLLRVEGKEYTVNDGDVVEFRFNV
jgi:ribosome-binding ATPase